MSRYPDPKSVRVEQFDSEEQPDLFALCREIRQEVFVVEQNVSPDLEWDGQDSKAIQFVAWLEDGDEHRAVGTARLRLFDDYAKAERVAVSSVARRHRVGSHLMRALEQAARQNKRRTIQLNAQLSALPFYEHLGYTAHGPVFVEAEIDHRAMMLSLA